MKLTQLLQLHEQFSDQSLLRQNFGDGYLAKHNLIFRNIRRHVLAEKYTFSSERNDLYHALPLSQLDWVLTEKKIPYINNVDVLKQIDSRLPGKIQWEEVSDNFKRNYLFHESCHGVAQSLRFSSEGLKQSQKILQKMMEESFANTCELLAVVDAEDRAHRIFFEMNSYVVMFNFKTDLKNAIAKMGHQTIAKFMMMCYLQANFLREDLPEKDFNRFLQIAARNSTDQSVRTFDSAEKKTLRALSKISFQLNPQFRMVTTGFYLRLAGFANSMEEMLDFDFISDLESDPRFQKFFEDLASVMTN